MIRGVAGSMDRLQGEIVALAVAGERQRPSPTHAQVGGEVLGRTEAHDLGPRGPGQRGRAGRVVGMGVGDENGAERSPGLHGGQRTAARWLSTAGPGSITASSPEPIR